MEELGSLNLEPEKGGIRRRAALLVLAAITIAFFIAAVWNVGSHQFPSSNWIPGNSDIRLDLGAPASVGTVYLLIQEDKPVSVEAYSGFPESWTSRAKLDEPGTYQQWRKLVVGSETQYIRLVFSQTYGEVGEVVVFSGSEKLEVRRILDAAGSEAAAELIDEQSLLLAPPTSEDETYFDEIYFVQGAVDYLNGRDSFEWSHPPLGKFFISLGILLFGNNPFGWRIIGVILAALMIPLVYLLARRVSGSERGGLICAFLVAVDFMHFSMARMATGETFLVLFLLLMFYFFCRYYQESSPRDMFLAVLCFGLAFSVKWVAIYGFIAVLILFFGLRWRSGISRAETIYLVGGLGAAVAVYILCYIPYFFNGHGIAEFVRLQLSMFGYHSGLEASHPYSAPWWSWPIMVRPLWLYTGQVEGFSSNIMLLGNPALWWGGIAAVLLTGWLALRRKDKTALFIAIPFFAQWLLFIPIPRVLFIYHFYPCVLFMALAVTFWLEKMQPRWRWGVVAYLALATGVFLLCYPLISGMPVSQDSWYWAGVRWVLGW